VRAFRSAAAGATGSASSAGSSSRNSKACPGALEVPLDAVGEHAQRNLRPDADLGPVADREDGDVGPLEGT